MRLSSYFLELFYENFSCTYLLYFKVNFVNIGVGLDFWSKYDEIQLGNDPPHFTIREIQFMDLYKFCKLQIKICNYLQLINYSWVFIWSQLDNVVVDKNNLDLKSKLICMGKCIVNTHYPCDLDTALVRI